MKNPKFRQKIARKARPKTEIRSLVVLRNQAQIRADYIKKYQLCLDDMQTNLEKLRFYKEVEIPAYELWLEQEFEQERYQLLDWSQRCEALESLVETIEVFRDLRGGSYFKAYTYVVAAKDAEQLTALREQLREQLQKRQEEEENAAIDEYEEDDEELAELMREFYSENFAETNDAESKQQCFSNEEQEHEITKDNPRGNRGTYLKNLYRQLVRLLHPDAVTHTATQIVLWHEVQQAYEWGDVAGLERILRHLHGDVSNEQMLNFEAMSVSDILLMQRDIEARFKHICEDLRVAKTRPAWGFHGVRKDEEQLQRLAVKVKQYLDMEEYMLKVRYDDFDETLKKWARPPRTGSRSKAAAPVKGKVPKQEPIHV